MLVSFNPGNARHTAFVLFDGVTYRTQAGPALFLRLMLAAVAIAPFSGVRVHAASTADPMAILPAPAPAEQPADKSEDRILGVIPNYQTVNDSTVPVAPLTPKQKWSLALRETMDPFNIANAAVGSGFSQMGNQTPKYGEGGQAFALRFAAAWGDLATQNFFSGGLLATVLHQDPRYYRRGPQSGVLKRIAYSVSRVVVTRTDSGHGTFNSSGVFGMAMGIAASNVYYPAQSVRGEVMVARLSTSVTSSIIGNLTAEFWPDIQKKFFHKRTER
jgi:hypothetical protein